MVGPFRPGACFLKTVALWSFQMQLTVTIKCVSANAATPGLTQTWFSSRVLLPPAPTFPAMYSHLAELTLPFPLHIKAAQKQSKDLEIPI